MLKTNRNTETKLITGRTYKIEYRHSKNIGETIIVIYNGNIFSTGIFYILPSDPNILKIEGPL